MNYESTQLAEIATRFVNSTNQSIFLTGKAGTGKTTFLKHIVNNTHKQTIIAAPTGIAAINAGGMTLHSLFQLPFGSFVPQNIQFTESQAYFAVNTPQSIMKGFQMNSTKRAMIREMELLIIDEVSMLRADLLDAIDVILRSIRRKRNMIFGGVQILFIGDLLQLPPVVKDQEWGLLKQFYKSPFFFEAHALRESKPVYIELDKVFRQSDQHFINILNHFRENKVSKYDIDELNKRFYPDFDSKDEPNVINLTTHNYKADRINKNEIEALKGKDFKYHAEIKGDFKENNYPIDETLILKVGAQIMFIKNDPTGEQKFFNGKIGQISNLSNNEIEVKFSENSEPFLIEKYTWENKRYTLNKETNGIEETINGTFEHYPIKLAWAITVHKSQGLTFERAVIDINDAFAQGQVYVALSRLTSLDGLILRTKINYESLGIESSVKEFSKLKESVQNLENRYTNDSQKYINDFVLNAFDFSLLKGQIRYHIESYNKDANRSEKQAHVNWARKIDSDFNQAFDVANKFMKQIYQISHSNSDDIISRLNERSKAAQAYFEPILKQNSKNVLEHINAIKSKKGIKKYITELQILELQFFSQNQKILKALALINASINNTSLHKKIVSNELNQRLAQKKEPAKKFSKKKEPGKPKEKKIPTKVVSYELFKLGKNLDEIAETRQFKKATILNHLKFYVETGVISANEFISNEKIEKILEIRDEIDTLHLTPIKEKLGNSYSYEEIGIVIAEYKFKNNIQPESNKN